MQFDNSFSVQARIDDVFEAVSDIARVVPCVPGAKLLDRRGDDVYEVALRARLRHGATMPARSPSTSAICAHTVS